MKSRGSRRPGRPGAVAFAIFALAGLASWVAFVPRQAGGQDDDPILIDDRAHKVEDEEKELDDAARKEISDAIQRDGEFKDGVYRVVIPRDDLFVSIEGMDVPSAAGLESDFRFYRCPCGKTNVVGQFCLADYETNDVVDALRAGQVEVSSVGPMLLHEKPRLMIVRFQAEGEAAALAKTLKSALDWTGEARSATRPVEPEEPDEEPQE